ASEVLKPRSRARSSPPPVPSIAARVLRPPKIEDLTHEAEEIDERPRIKKYASALPRKRAQAKPRKVAQKQPKSSATPKDDWKIRWYDRNGKNTNTIVHRSETLGDAKFVANRVIKIPNAQSVRWTIENVATGKIAALGGN